MTNEELNEAKEELFRKVNDAAYNAIYYEDFWNDVVKAVGKRGFDTMKDIIMNSDIPFKYQSLEEDTDVIYNFMRLMIVEYVLTEDYIYIPSILELF